MAERNRSYSAAELAAARQIAEHAAAAAAPLPGLVASGDVDAILTAIADAQHTMAALSAQIQAIQREHTPD